RARRRRIWLGLLVVLVGLALFTGVRTAQAARAGVQGKRMLLAAEQDINDQKLEPARQHLAQAKASFDEMQAKMRGLGPLLSVARLTPLVRVQVRGVEAFGDAGTLVSQAGLRLVDAASGLIEPGDAHVPVSAAL